MNHLMEKVAEATQAGNLSFDARLTDPREKVGRVFQRVDQIIELNGIAGVFPVKEIANQIVKAVQPVELRRRLEYGNYTHNPISIQPTHQLLRGHWRIQTKYKINFQYSYLVTTPSKFTTKYFFKYFPLHIGETKRPKIDLLSRRNLLHTKRKNNNSHMKNNAAATRNRTELLTQLNTIKATT